MTAQMCSIAIHTAFIAGGAYPCRFSPLVVGGNVSTLRTSPRRRFAQRCSRPILACSASSSPSLVKLESVELPPEQKRTAPTPWDVLCLARPQWRILTGGILCALVSAGILLLTPAALGRVLDAVAKGPEAQEALNVDAVKLLFLYFAGACAKLFEVSMLRTAGERIVSSLRQDVFRKMISLDVSKLDETSPGSLLSRLQSDSYDLQNVVTRDLPNIVTGFMETLFGFCMLLYICRPLTPLVALTVPPTVAAAAIYGKRTATYARNLSAALARASDVATEQLSGIRVVKAFVREALSFQKYRNSMNEVLTLGTKVAIADGVLQAWNRLVFTVKTVAILWLGGKYVALGRLTVGGLFSFAIYTSNISSSLGKFAGACGELMRSSGSVARVLEILKTTPLIEKPVAEQWTKPLHDCEGLSGSIEFRNVTFTYPGRLNEPALQNVSFTVEAGSSIAFVGRSGGGKSTAVTLLLRFHDTTYGNVLIDGRPIDEYDVRYIREHLIGIVPQEPVLFTGTVADNIGFGKDGASMKEIEAAAYDAGVMDFAARLPDGLNTKIGPSAGSLSGGEKQRVMIARCLVKEPRIIILDEATSALDSASEAMVNETIERLMMDRRRTILLISHRLSIAPSCDRIVVLDRGQVREIGSHADLATRTNGLYSELLSRNRVNSR